jgi:hypothetical protein
MYAEARNRGLIGGDTTAIKRHIRDTVRALPDGELHWQRLQAAAYGPRMAEADIVDGVREFLSICKDRRARVFIISHKTEFATMDETRTNLHACAMEWMCNQGLFAWPNFLSRHEVFFEVTRTSKIERIRELGCTHFIDDLEETFIEPTFPHAVQKFLYAPVAVREIPDDIIPFSDWRKLGESLLNGTCHLGRNCGRL